VEVSEDGYERDIFEVAWISSKMLEILDESAQKEDPRVDQAPRYCLCGSVQIFSGAPEEPGQEAIVCQRPAGQRSQEDGVRTPKMTPIFVLSATDRHFQ
jgi:hypothetical protein